jgi:hypothetical protein
MPDVGLAHVSHGLRTSFECEDRGTRQRPRTSHPTATVFPKAIASPARRRMRCRADVRVAFPPHFAHRASRPIAAAKIDLIDDR